MAVFNKRSLFNYSLQELPRRDSLEYASEQELPSRDSLEDASENQSFFVPAGPAKNQDQFLNDLNRNRERYFFNGRSVLQLMKEAKANDAQWFENEGARLQFKDADSALAFTKEYLLINTDEAFKDLLISDIARHIHQGGLNYVAVMAVHGANAAWVSSQTKVGKLTSHFSMSEPTSEISFVSMPNGISITSIHTYQTGVYTAYPDSGASQITGIKAEGDGYLAKVLSEVQLQRLPDQENPVITPKKVWVDVQDDRFSVVLDKRHLLRKIWDSIKSIFQPKMIQPPAKAEIQALPALSLPSQKAPLSPVDTREQPTV